jgi:hypothetical protein
MNIPEKRHDDIVIERRFLVHPQTHLTIQVYAVTSPNRTDRGTEQRSYEEAERVALELAEKKGLSVWYEETPQSAKRTLVRSFGAAASSLILDAPDATMKPRMGS